MSIDGDGQFKTSLERVRRHLRASKAKHVLVGAANDPSALGAARAFQEAGRAATCAIAGQNAEPDARAELRAPRTPLVATVGYFPEKYGDGLIRLALDLLTRKAVPPAVFVRHQIVTRETSITSIRTTRCWASSRPRRSERARRPRTYSIRSPISSYIIDHRFSIAQLLSPFIYRL